MPKKLKDPLHNLLRRSEKYTKTDMVHFFSANFWLNFSRIISVGTGMLLTVAFANLLTPEQFGTYKYAIASAGFVATFTLNGLGAAVMRAVAQGKKNVVPAVVRTAIFWSIPASIATLGISFYYFAQGNSDLGYIFLFIAISNTFATGLGTTKGIWVGLGDFKTPAIYGIPRILVPFIIILLTIVITKNVVWIVLAYFASSTIASWLGYLWMLRRLKIHGSPEHVAETIRYGKQMSVLAFFQIGAGQIDQLLLWHFTTPATLALYALALGPMGEAKNLINNFLSVSFRKIASKTEEVLYKTLTLRLWQMFWVCAVMTAGYIVLVPFLFTYLFPKYIDAILVSQILALSILLLPRGLIDTFFVTHGQVKKRSAVILTSQGVRFALICGLIPLFGLWGAVAAILLSELSTAIIYLIVYLQGRKNALL